jgi:hypothetical protein
VPPIKEGWNRNMFLWRIGRLHLLAVPDLQFFPERVRFNIVPDIGFIIACP